MTGFDMKNIDSFCIVCIFNKYTNRTSVYQTIHLRVKPINSADMLDNGRAFGIVVIIEETERVWNKWIFLSRKFCAFGLFQPFTFATRVFVTFYPCLRLC